MVGRGGRRAVVEKDPVERRRPPAHRRVVGGKAAPDSPGAARRWPRRRGDASELQACAVVAPADADDPRPAWWILATTGRARIRVRLPRHHRTSATCSRRIRQFEQYRVVEPGHDQRQVRPARSRRSERSVHPAPTSRPQRDAQAGARVVPRSGAPGEYMPLRTSAGHQFLVVDAQRWRPGSRPDSSLAIAATPPLAAPVIPAPTAEKDPIVEPDGTRADRRRQPEAPAEAPAEVIADVPAPPEPRRPSRPRSWTQRPQSRSSAEQPMPTEPPRAWSCVRRAHRSPASGRDGPGRSRLRPNHMDPNHLDPKFTTAAAGPYEPNPTGNQGSNRLRPNRNRPVPRQPPTQTHPRRQPPRRPQLRQRLRRSGDDETKVPTSGAPARRTRKGKPVMPSWDEVLLGVRGPRPA